VLKKDSTTANVERG